MSILKGLIVSVVFLITTIHGSEYDHALSQFLSHTHFRDVQIVNKMDAPQDLHVKFVQYRKLEPGQSIHVKIKHYQSILCDGTEYTHDFSFENTKAESAYFKLTYTLETSLIPEAVLNGSMIKYMRSNSTTPVQYELTLPPEQEENPFHQKQPLIINLVHQAAPILCQLMPCDQNKLRARQSKMSDSTQYFHDNILTKHIGRHEQCHQVFQQSYDNTIARLRAVPVDAAFKIPLDIHTIWLTDYVKPRIPPQECFDLWKETTQVCSPQHGWRYHIWVHNLELIPPCPDMDPPIIVHDMNDIFKADELKFLQSYYLGAIQVSNFGLASDIARLGVLYLHGGVYRDTDFAFIKTPKALHQVCSFYCGLEGNDGIAPCNAMIASAPKHPIIKRYLDHIGQNFKKIGMRNNPLRDLHSDVYKTLFYTGPFAFAHILYAAVQDPKMAEDILNDVCIAPSYVFFCHPYLKDGRIMPTWPWMALGKHLHRKDWISGR